jgi:PTH1 family peptidyl-tRNA hydrolase
VPTALKLIVGLGNPGSQYAQTRHNVGADWIRELAQQFQIPLALDSKFKAEIGRGTLYGHDLRLMIPVTYMNNSGEAVGTVARFYKLTPQEILIAHDEVAFDPGVVRLKNGGGENGHNGLKSVRSRLANSSDYNRLRIGVGHPGNKALVNHYLTQQTPTKAERELVKSSGHLSSLVLEAVVAGKWQSAMTALHSPEKEAGAVFAQKVSLETDRETKNSSGESDGI